MSCCTGTPTGRSSFTCTAMRSRRASRRVRSPKCASKRARPDGSRSICMPARRERKRCLAISKSIRSNALLHTVIPAEAGIQRGWVTAASLDHRIRGGDFARRGDGCSRALLFGLLAAASLLATPAAAHGFGQRYDLPLPLSLYLFGAAAAVVVSFIIVGLFVRGGASRSGFDRRFDLMSRGIGRFILHPATGLVPRLVAFAIFAMTVAAGFIGNQDPYRNIAPTMVWVIFWVGLAYVSAFAGDIWALANPWRTVFAAVERLSKGVANHPCLRYPEPLGVWPACA